MPTLRREVELPRRPYQRASVYLGLGSLVVSLLFVLDAPRWTGSAVHAAAAETRQAALDIDRAATAARLRAARLRAAPCRAAREADARAAAAARADAAARAAAARAAAAAAAIEQADIHSELMRQLERAPAVLDDVDPIGRYGKMNLVEPDAVQRYQKALHAPRTPAR